MILDIETVQFIDRLVARVKNERVFNSVMEDWKQNKGTWDKVARENLGKIVEEIFNEIFTNEDINSELYIEGKRFPTSWKKPSKLFGSVGCYPDIAVLSHGGFTIELDHSERGSGLKMALAKAAFGYLSGDWKNCFLFFYNQNGNVSLENEKDRKISRFYEEQLNTKIFLFH